MTAKYLRVVLCAMNESLSWVCMLASARNLWAFSVLVVIFPIHAAAVALGARIELPPCSQGARAFSPCEITFGWKQSELPPDTSPYKDELLNVEFRSPQHTTYLIRSFWEGGDSLRVRFTPTESGTWTYRVLSSIKRYDSQEASFNVAESGAPGFVSVANVRHWWTTNKQPHLWLAASVPFFEIEQPSFETWLDARKHDGFTHVRGAMLTLGGPTPPLASDHQPNFAYFRALDDRILAAVNRGFTVDLLLADKSFVRSAAFSDYNQREAIIRYVIARYGSLNITWQGIEHFEEVAGSRALLKELASFLQKYDGYQHPRSTDAQVSSSPLLPDGWMNYLIEASPHPELAAVEHQFTQEPEIHVITTTDPDTFRHELWNCTTNGEYPSVSYDALRNEANVKAIHAWFSVISDTRHWEFEPYFDVSGARAVGLEEIGFIAYAQTPGILEISLPRHKYNPFWVNPLTGEEIPLKDYRGEILNRQTPDNSHDWVLDVEREGHKESMLRSVYFQSIDAPIQEVETDPTKIPFDIVDPPGDSIVPGIPTPFKAKLTRNNRATRDMQYVWWGDVVAGGDGARLLAVGSSGNFVLPKNSVKDPGSTLNVRLLAINANGKAYEVDKVYSLGQ